MYVIIMSITGSKNTLLGYGAALPNPAASNQIVIGSQNATTYIGGGVTGGITISGSSLTLVGNTALTVSGNAGISGQFLVSGGAGSAPYWGPALPGQLTGTSWTLANPLSNLYTVQGSGTNSWNLALPDPATVDGTQLWVKNMASASGAVSPSIVNQGSTGAPTSNVIMMQGDSASFLSDGTSWYVTYASENLVTNPLYVSSVTPSTGSAPDETVLTLTGTGFTGASAVTVNGAAATINSVAPTTIVAVAPAGSAGSASVVVVATLGRSLPNQLYTYLPGVKFLYTGANQQWQVPTGVTQVTATVAGSVGEYAGGLGGAGGCIITGILAVTPGTTLTIVCGGYDGIYAGSGYWGLTATTAGYGGGYSAVLLNTSQTSVWQPATANDIFIMAGGGGGSCGYTGGRLGGIGGFTQGGNSQAFYTTYATGGTQNQGGTGASNTAGGGGVNGSQYQGGAGQFINPDYSGIGGGGGGGWYGGGGGSEYSGNQVGGGGGSSYPVTDTDRATITSHSDGSNAGKGYVTLRWT